MHITVKVQPFVPVVVHLNLGKKAGNRLIKRPQFAAQNSRQMAIWRLSRSFSAKLKWMRINDSRQSDVARRQEICQHLRVPL
jgi:hypothetical protein